MGIAALEDTIREYRHLPVPAGKHRRRSLRSRSISLHARTDGRRAGRHADDGSHRGAEYYSMVLTNSLEPALTPTSSVQTPLHLARNKGVASDGGNVSLLLIMSMLASAAREPRPEPSTRSTSQRRPVTRICPASQRPWRPPRLTLQTSH